MWMEGGDGGWEDLGPGGESSSGSWFLTSGPLLVFMGVGEVKVGIKWDGWILSLGFPPLS